MSSHLDHEQSPRDGLPRLRFHLAFFGWRLCWFGLAVLTLVGSTIGSSPASAQQSGETQRQSAPDISAGEPAVGTLAKVSVEADTIVLESSVQIRSLSGQRDFRGRIVFDLFNHRLGPNVRRIELPEESGSLVTRVDFHSVGPEDAPITRMVVSTLDDVSFRTGRREGGEGDGVGDGAAVVELWRAEGVAEGDEDDEGADSRAERGTADREPSIVLLTTSRVVVRGGPGLERESLGTIPGGIEVEALRLQGDWVLVRWSVAPGELAEGWVAMNALRLPEESDRTTRTPTRTIGPRDLADYEPPERESPSSHDAGEAEVATAAPVPVVVPDPAISEPALREPDVVLATPQTAPTVAAEGSPFGDEIEARGDNDVAAQGVEGGLLRAGPFEVPLTSPDASLLKRLRLSQDATLERRLAEYVGGDSDAAMRLDDSAGAGDRAGATTERNLPDAMGSAAPATADPIDVPAPPRRKSAESVIGPPEDDGREPTRTSLAEATPSTGGLGKSRSSDALTTSERARLLAQLDRREQELDEAVRAHRQAEAAVVELERRLARVQEINRELRLGQRSGAQLAEVGVEEHDAAALALHDWAEAWSAGDVAAYLGHYARAFDPPGDMDREAWARLRARRLEEPSWIDVRVAFLSIETLTSERVRASFLQQYRSDRYSDLTRKLVELSLDDGAWRIVLESAESMY